MGSKPFKHVLYLGVPFLLLFVLAAGIIFAVVRNTGLPTYFFFGFIFVFLAAFLFSFLLQFALVREKLLANTVELEEMKQVLADEDRSAKLLVRRDLELTRANERLRKLDDAKSSFISVVAHQLRTPLSGIKWTLNLLMQGELGRISREQREFLRKAYVSNDRMIALVNDMLDADRIESGKTRYHFAAVDLLALADDALFELAPAVAARKMRVSFPNRPTSLPKVRADVEKLRNVFGNLLENAVKYSRDRGTIEVRMRVSEGGDEVEVAIRDSGIGIPKAQQRSIFERFFRASNAMHTETQGTGLGLFIVHSIVGRHGGRIWFESKEGRGVTFYFTVPVVREA